MSDVTLLTGAAWGIAGAIVMMIIMQLGSGDSPPPFAVFWSKFVGGGSPDDAMPQALLLHFIYAAGAGLAYAFVTGAFTIGLNPLTTVGGLVLGVVWGLVLFVIGAAVWVQGFLGMEPDQNQVMQFGVVHLAFGLALGLLAAFVPHLL